MSINLRAYDILLIRYQGTPRFHHTARIKAQKSAPNSAQNSREQPSASWIKLIDTSIKLFGNWIKFAGTWIKFDGVWVKLDVTGIKLTGAWIKLYGDWIKLSEKTCSC